MFERRSNITPYRSSFNFFSSLFVLNHFCISWLYNIYFSFLLVCFVSFVNRLSVTFICFFLFFLFLLVLNQLLISFHSISVYLFSLNVLLTQLTPFTISFMPISLIFSGEDVIKFIPSPILQFVYVQRSNEVVALNMPIAIWFPTNVLMVLNP